ncbi:MAG: PQQ-binding-like beta-propeller repeat protein, partial [Halobaculum sp.]
MSSPVGWTDAVVVADTRGIAVTPLDASRSGRAVELPGSAPRTPALRGDAIFTTRAETGGEPVVVRLDSSGTEEWQRTLPGAEITAPVVADGRLFLGTDERHVALDAETGKRVWAVGDGLSTRDWDQQLTENLAPAVAADTVVFPTGDGVLAVDTSSGSIAWRLNGDQVRSAPVVRDGRVYVPDFGFGIRVLDLHTGDAVWQFPADGTWATPVVTDSRVYAGTTRGVVALRRGSIDTDSAEPVEQTADTAAPVEQTADTAA